MKKAKVSTKKIVTTKATSTTTEPTKVTKHQSKLTGKALKGVL